MQHQGDRDLVTIFIPGRSATTEGAANTANDALRHEETNQLVTAALNGRAVFVVGDAGVGKTQLVNYAVKRLRSRPDSPHIISLYPEDSDANLLDLIGARPHDAAQRSDATFISRALLEWMRVNKPLNTLSDDGSGSSVSRSTPSNSQPPTVLRVEDGHKLDDASARALNALIRNQELAAVVTMRSAAARLNPWFGMWKNDDVLRLDLHSFSREETAAYLTSKLRGPVTADTVWRIWQHTGGNPYHVAGLTRDQMARHAFFEIEGVWIWDGSPGPDPRLHDIVADDLQRLGEGSRLLLESLALLGPLPLHVLYDVAPHDDIADLDRRGLLTTQEFQEPGTEREMLTGVMHDLYADAVRSRISSSRRIEILKQAERHITETSSLAEVRGRFVNLAVENSFPIDPRLVLRTVRSLITQHKPRTAIQLATAAMDSLVIPRRKVKLLILRAEAHRQADSPDHSIRDLDDADLIFKDIDFKTEPSGPRLVLSHSRVRANLIQLHFNDPQGAVQHLIDRRDALLNSIPAEDHSTWIDAFNIAILTHRGYAGEHDTVNVESVELLSRRTSAPEHLIALAAPTALGLAQRGNLQQALEISSMYLGVAYAHLDRYLEGPAELLAAHSTILIWAGEIDLIVNPHPGIRTESDPAGFDRVTDHLSRALVATVQGSWNVVAEEMHAANARFTHSDNGGMLAYCLYVEALAHAASGNANAARTVLQRADKTPRRSMSVIDVDLDLIKVDTLIWLRNKGAAEAALELATKCRALGATRNELEALHRFITRTVAVTPSSAQGTAGRPESPASALTAAKTPARSATPASAAERANQEALQAALIRITELREVVDGARPTLLVEHALACAAGDTDMAQIYERDLTRRGLWLAPMQEPVDLTRREREIATLAAGGMSSKAIAHRLTLSVRTVDSHLSRVFTKTGVHSRTELAQMLR